MPIEKFNYDLDYKTLDLRIQPDLYRVGIGEQGVLSVEPYKSEILPFWRFSTPQIARQSAHQISKLYRQYKKNEDFVGMDMCRKFLQMGFTRSRRYANHRGGRKYDQAGEVNPYTNDLVKAESAQIFYEAWQKVEADPTYHDLKYSWKAVFG